MNTVNVTIVSASTNKIIRVVTCSQEESLKEAKAGEIAVDGYYDPDEYERDPMTDSMVPIQAPEFNLSEAKELKRKALSESYQRANLDTFTHAGKQYSAHQAAQNNLNAISNYISNNDTLPPSFPMVWLSVDGSILSVVDVAAFNALYASFVEQGNQNFIKLAQLEQQVIDLPITATQADLDLIVW